MWAQSGGSTCGESEEGEQERVRALEETLEFCLLSPQLSLASPSLPCALTGPCENAPSQAAGENLCSWEGFRDLVQWSYAHLSTLLGELLSLCV